MKPSKTVWIVLAALAAVAIAGAIGAKLFFAPAPPPLRLVVVEPVGDGGSVPFCASEFTPIEGDGCFAAPPSLAAPVPLLVYLHGRYSPSTLDEELVRQSRVARLGNAKGFAVLAMRGVQGECTQAELADTWCWPSNPRNEADGPAFFDRLKPAMAAARARIGVGPSALLGFSNGAYFAALIATRSLGPFDAIAIAHGGPVQPTHALGTTPPLLLLTADDDPSDGEMRQLDAELTRETWAHELVAREGAHALLDWDVDIALTFFVRAQKERLPLSPPLQPPHVRVVASESGAGGEGEEDTEGGEEGDEDDGSST
jgi:predicted esterase